MPWKETCAVDERYRFVIEAQSYLGSFTELCEWYGISTKTGYKWLMRYGGEGVAGLQDRSRAPHDHPNEINEETQEAILQERRAHPTWGPKKLLVVLKAREGERAWPGQSTIGEILKRNGLTVARKRRRRACPWTQPFSGCEAANQVWCADFKGWFRTGDGSRCDPLTVMDGYSRYLLRCQTVADLTHEVARGVFEAAFREYGLPAAIRTDNGPPFASTGLGGLSRLSVWWLKLGIEPQRIEPGKPQQNGRHERMHLTLKKETASPAAQTLWVQQKRFDFFRQEYNHQRPHEGLAMGTPASVYRSSQRSYPGRVRDPEYGREFEVRRVGDRGEFRSHGVKIFLGYALEGELIGLRTCDERYWKIYFDTLELGIFDSYALRVLNPREAARVKKACQQAESSVAVTADEMALEQEVVR
jgi:putative transposase